MSRYPRARPQTEARVHRVGDADRAEEEAGARVRAGPRDRPGEVRLGADLQEQGHRRGVRVQNAAQERRGDGPPGGGDHATPLGASGHCDPQGGVRGFGVFSSCNGVVSRRKALRSDDWRGEVLGTACRTRANGGDVGHQVLP